MAFELCGLQDVRGEGLSITDASDARVGLAIRIASERIASITGQQFFPVTYTTEAPLLLEGSGTDVLELPSPALSLVSISEGASSLSANDYIDRSGRLPTDDRMYPRLIKRSGWRPWFPDMIGRPRWYRPELVSLVGTFGFLDGTWQGGWSSSTTYAEGDAVQNGNQTYLAMLASTGASPATDDGTNWQTSAAPLLIRRCCIDLVLREYRLKTDPDAAQATMMAHPKMEKTDGHEYQLEGVVATGLWTGDPAIDNVLVSYRRISGGTTGRR